MKTIQAPTDMQALALQAKQNGKTVGLVPTMGFLHEGHASLIRIARARADLVVVSIFVNPIQFGPSEDFAKYPRDFALDSRLCEAEGTDILFAPQPADMYAPNHSVHVDECDLSSGLCGKSRPGHFRGVATVVAKLFNIVLPDLAVFGQKDAQQVRVIQRMARDLNFPVRIVVGPIAREPDGLAMSSRNVYLSPPERKRALCLSHALKRATDLYAEGVRDSACILSEMKRIIGEAQGQIDYAEVVDNETLAPVKGMEHAVLVALAVKIGKTRLIDNTMLGPGA